MWLASSIVSSLSTINKGNGTFATGVSYSLGATVYRRVPCYRWETSTATRKPDISVSIAGDNVGRGAGNCLAGQRRRYVSSSKKPPQESTIRNMPPRETSTATGSSISRSTVTATGGCPSDAAYILLGNGDGTFQAPTVAFPGTGSLAAVDLNGDGKLDLIHYAAVVQIYLGNGDSTFSIASMYLPSLAAITSNFALAVADFNSDDKPDIAAGGGIFLGLGNGAFQGIQLGGVPDDPIAVATGDFDKNGTVDVVAISSDSLYVLSNNGGGQLTLTHNYSLQQPGIGVVTADLNGDGNLDFAVLGVNSTDQSWSYSVFLGNGDGSFQSPVTYPQSTMSGSVFWPRSDRRRRLQQ